MIDIGWEERVYPAAKIAVVVEGLAAEGVSAAAGLQGTAIAPDELRSPTTLVSVTQVIVAYRNALRTSVGKIDKKLLRKRFTQDEE